MLKELAVKEPKLGQAFIINKKIQCHDAFSEGIGSWGLSLHQWVNPHMTS